MEGKFEYWLNILLNMVNTKLGQEMLPLQRRASIDTKPALLRKNSTKNPNTGLSTRKSFRVQKLD